MRAAPRLAVAAATITAVLAWPGTVYAGSGLAGPGLAGPGAGPGLATSGLANPGAACVEAIRGAEQASALPHALLLSIGVVESGRPDPGGRRVAPWPWTINVEGVGSYFETRGAAIAAVESARAAGHRSIDVGCMQINLMHHPTAFADLETAFDPGANATYAANFLLALHAQNRDWGDAAAAYHSQTPGMSDDYRRRVVANWGGASQYGVVQRAVIYRPSGAPGQERREPEGGYTPEFRARLAQDAADGRALRVAMGILPTPSRLLQAGRGTALQTTLPRFGIFSPGTVANHRRQADRRAAPRSMLQASLADRALGSAAP